MKIPKRVTQILKFVLGKVESIFEVEKLLVIKIFSFSRNVLISSFLCVIKNCDCVVKSKGDIFSVQAEIEQSTQISKG